MEDDLESVRATCADPENADPGLENASPNFLISDSRDEVDGWRFPPNAVGSRAGGERGQIHSGLPSHVISCPP